MRVTIEKARKAIEDLKKVRKSMFEGKELFGEFEVLGFKGG